MTPVLLAECIAKRFGSRAVLTAATLRVEAGCVTALVGRNGIGKSTLLKIASGWIRPDQGTVQFQGRGHLHPRLHHLAEQGLFYLPDRELLSPGFSVREHLDSVTRRWGRGDTIEVARLTGLEASDRPHSRRANDGERSWRSPCFVGPFACWPTSRTGDWLPRIWKRYPRSCGAWQRWGVDS